MAANDASALLKRMLLPASLVLGLGGCASQGALPEYARNQFVTEFFAFVGDVRDVRFESHAGEAAIYGAAEGALITIDHDEHMLAGALFGAAFAGIATALIEGDRRGYEYVLNAIDGDQVLVVVDKKNAAPGDCVLVRVAGDVFLQKVDDKACENPYPVYTTGNFDG